MISKVVKGILRDLGRVAAASLSVIFDSSMMGPPRLDLVVRPRDHA
jgi:hypothetical protein